MEIIAGGEAGADGSASAYSTGGGDVVLEHAYGGALLAELLLGGPVAASAMTFLPCGSGSSRAPTARLMISWSPGRARRPADALHWCPPPPEGRREPTSPSSS